MKLLSQRNVRVATESVKNAALLALEVVDLARSLTTSVVFLRRKSKSIAVGDTVVIRLCPGGNQSLAGRIGFVVYKCPNPVWTSFSILINGERHRFGIDEIERTDHQ